MNAVKDDLAFDLPDNESIRFTRTCKRTATDVHGKKHEGAICGFLNPKNRFGAYEGFRPFYKVDGITSTIAAAKDEASINQFVEKYCDYCSDTGAELGACLSAARQTR